MLSLVRRNTCLTHVQRVVRKRFSLQPNHATIHNRAFLNSWHVTNHAKTIKLNETKISNMPITQNSKRPLHTGNTDNTDKTGNISTNNASYANKILDEFGLSNIESGIANYSIAELQAAYMRDDLMPSTVTDLMIGRIQALQPQFQFMVGQVGYKAHTGRTQRQQTSLVWSDHAQKLAARCIDVRDRIFGAVAFGVDSGDSGDIHRSVYGVPYTTIDSRWQIPASRSSIHDICSELTDQKSSRAMAIERNGVFLGQNNMPPIGYQSEIGPYTDICVNPYDPNRVGCGVYGAAMAVAMRCAYFTVGFESMGSIRQAASAMGLYGVVPAKGDPVFAKSKNLQPGVLARSLDDVITVLGPDYPIQIHYQIPLAQNFRILALNEKNLAPSIQRHFSNAIETISRDSTIWVDHKGETCLSYGQALVNYTQFKAHKALSSMNLTPEKLERFNPITAEFLRNKATRSSEEQMIWACQQINEAKRTTNEWFSKYDVIIQPTFYCNPWTTHAYPEPKDPSSISQVSIYNGHACASIPIGMSDAGQPIGLHIAVKNLGDTEWDKTKSTILLLQVLKRIDAMVFDAPKPFAA